ncbi:Vacuolar protein-sorting-associated protein 36 [Borealophlyctis nickersoniae]|nr:Vacuolar protein-sorting-associated protein 36 [Borealophlyctis nickersoniae]
MAVEAPVASMPQTGPRVGGISGIMRSVEQTNKVRDSALGEAFTDLNALMEKAAEMVKLAESISSKLSQTSSSENDESVDMAAFRTYLVDLGISSPVTRQTAGDMYTQELSRQLAEFAEKVLDRTGGMMALTDLYCLFNRARGVALISPDDLQKACAQFPHLHLPFHLRKFDSGLLVIQSDKHSDEETARRAHEKVMETAQGVTAVALAAKGKVSVVLALEQLLMTEKRGLICRDDTVEGLRFYDNLIAKCEVGR